MAELRRKPLIETAVFEIARSRGIGSDRALARAMGVSPSLVGRVRAGQRGINDTFISGAQRAFPDMTLDELFSVSTVTTSEAIA